LELDKEWLFFMKFRGFSETGRVIYGSGDYHKLRSTTAKRKTASLERDDKKDLYLEDKEVRQLIKAAGTRGRNRHRNATMILIAYNHGLRASEVCSLRWENVNLEKKIIYVMRCKGSKSGEHPLYPEDCRALSRLGKQTGFVFKSESVQNPGPVTAIGFHRIVQLAGKAAGLGSSVHPHQLRHACGHRLRLERKDVLDIQEWLGHRNIANTQLYAQGGADHFRRVFAIPGSRGDD
jgi:type 1 fimbriae regulatory protein FimE